MENRETVGSPMAAREGKCSANIIVPRSGKHRSTNSASPQRVCVVHWKQKKTQQLGFVPIPTLGSLSLTSGENTQMDLYVLWTKITPLLKC